MLSGLIELFGNFVREIHIPVEAIEAQVDFPPELHAFRTAVGHHLIPLLLLARVDRDFAQCECEIIVGHCVSFAQRRGVACNETDIAALREYVTSFRPAPMQLDPAIARLRQCEHSEFHALVAAARKLVGSDKVSRPVEAKFLARLEDELARLGPGGS
ncbi:MAG TPA: hypothetical protein VG891_11740 [Rhizomicrobium sp.]|nr:hypothetical protein [Rhizomicrobium sp.]